MCDLSAISTMMPTLDERERCVTRHANQRLVVRNPSRCTCQTPAWQFNASAKRTGVDGQQLTHDTVTNQ